MKLVLARLVDFLSLSRCYVEGNETCLFKSRKDTLHQISSALLKTYLGMCEKISVVDQIPDLLNIKMLIVFKIVEWSDFCTFYSRFWAMIWERTNWIKHGQIIGVTKNIRQFFVLNHYLILSYSRQLKGLLTL